MQWLMLQQEKPDDFVIATGVQHSVRDFINFAAEELGMQINWRGEGKYETGWLIGRDTGSRGPIVRVDQRYFRPTEVETLLGDASKARNKLGWQPRISFADLVKEMVRSDLEATERDALIKHHGYKTMNLIE
jgi:GDPmannose 4,6-dehydratase